MKKNYSCIRVVRKLQFLNNFLFKTHFCRVLTRKNARIAREPIRFSNKSIFLFGIILVLCLASGCAGRRNTVFVPVPDESFFIFEKTIGINTGDIIETSGGHEAQNMPEWLHSYLEGGIEAVEALFSYRNKYVFIENNRGENFSALNKWLEFFIVKQDIARLIAARIERKMIVSASLYPDDEYGLFFERLIKNAYNSEYPDAALEDTYWIKIKTGAPSGEAVQDEEEYVFFIFASMEKLTMQNVLEEMMEDTYRETAPSARRRFFRNPQNASVNNLRQNFFEGF